MRILALITSALVLGYFSPWMESADDGLLLALWFNALPTMAAPWFELGPFGARALDVSILAAQYLALYAVLAPAVRPAARFLADFLSAPRHRSGLVR
jgi:hypothetical protein